MSIFYAVNRKEFKRYWNYVWSLYRNKVKLLRTLFLILLLFIAFQLLAVEKVGFTVQVLFLLGLPPLIFFGFDFVDWSTTYIIGDDDVERVIRIPILSYFNGGKIPYEKIDIVFYCRFSKRYFFRDVRRFPKLVALDGYDLDGVPFLIKMILKKNKGITPVVHKNFFIRKWDEISEFPEV